MTPKQRVICTLNHKEPDRIPWGEHSIDYNIYELILGRESLCHAKMKEDLAYREGRRDEIVESYKRDIVDLALALEMDILTVGSVPGREYRPKPLIKTGENSYTNEYGTNFMYSETTQDLLEIPVTTAFYKYDITMEEMEQKIADLSAVPIDEDHAISEYEVINHVVEKLGDTHFIIAPVNGIEWPRFGADDEESWINLYTYPEICRKIAQLQCMQTIRELQRLKHTGVDGILSVGDLGHTNNLPASPDLYKEIQFDFHKEIYAECKRLGLYVMRHCCGHVWPLINEIADYNDAYEGIQSLAGMDIKALKEAVGDRLTLWGGILHENIHSKTPYEIRKDAEYAFKSAGKDGGYIIGSSHSLTIGATYENIMEMKRVRDELGVYPL